MAKFDIGDIVYTIENPDKLYKVLNVDNITTDDKWISY